MGEIKSATLEVRCEVKVENIIRQRGSKSIFNEFEHLVLQRVIYFEDRIIDNPGGTREVTRITKLDTVKYFQDAGINPM